MGVYEEVAIATEQVRARLGGREPTIGLLLGSGFDQVVGMLQDPVSMQFTDIDGFCPSTTDGQTSDIHCGDMPALENPEALSETVIMMRGGAHLYDGVTAQQVVLPVRTMITLGCKVIMFVNGAGGIASGYRPGDLVLVTDHLNETGANPLEGPHDKRIGPRSPDMTNVYDRALRNTILRYAQRLEINCAAGTYACMRGPSFETPTEIKKLRTAGADLVGFSMALPAIAAHHMSARCVGICAVRGPAAGVDEDPPAREAALAAASRASPSLVKLLGVSVPAIAYHMRNAGRSS